MQLLGKDPDDDNHGDVHDDTLEDGDEVGVNEHMPIVVFMLASGAEQDHDNETD